MRLLEMIFSTWFYVVTKYSIFWNSRKVCKFTCRHLCTFYILQNCSVFWNLRYSCEFTWLLVYMKKVCTFSLTCNINIVCIFTYLNLHLYVWGHELPYVYLYLIFQNAFVKWKVDESTYIISAPMKRFISYQ